MQDESTKDIYDVTAMRRRDCTAKIKIDGKITHETMQKTVVRKVSKKISSLRVSNPSLS